MEGVYYTIDQNAKPVANNKFFLEQDAIDAACDAAVAFRCPIKVWVWNSFARDKFYEGTDAIHFATVSPEAQVDYHVQPLAQAAFSLEARGLTAEAQILHSLLAESSSISKVAKIPFEISEGEKGILEARISASLNDEGLIKITSVRFNGVEDDKNDHKKEVYHAKANNRAELDKLVNDIFREYNKYPPSFDSHEKAKFKLG